MPAASPFEAVAGSRGSTGLQSARRSRTGQAMSSQDASDRAAAEKRTFLGTVSVPSTSKSAMIFFDMVNVIYGGIRKLCEPIRPLE